MADDGERRDAHADWARTFRAFLDNDTRPGPRGGDVRRVRPSRARKRAERPAVP